MMSGWKTWTGAAALIMSGLAKLVIALTDFPTIDGVAFAEGFALVGAGLAGVGIGHKVEKNK